MADPAEIAAYTSGVLRARAAYQLDREGEPMYAANPDHKPRSRALCPHCEATPGGCSGMHFVSGRYCCERCTGDHDQDGPPHDRPPGGSSRRPKSQPPRCIRPSSLPETPPPPSNGVAQ